MSVIFNEKLSHKFYLRNAETVAKDLLGKIIVHLHNNKRYAAKIVEVEAYQGSTDKSAHSYGGISARNKVMFDEGGKLYVYLIYGIHFCANVVTGKQGQGDAVLIRAVEPLDGINFMTENRIEKKKIKLLPQIKLTNGPAKFCKAFDINKTHNGIDLTGNKIFIVKGEQINKVQIVSTTRIGITKSTELKWRYYIKDNKFVSRK